MHSFDHTPCNQWFGFHLQHSSPQKSVVELEPRPEFMQETGIVHGGLISALADTAAVYAVRPHLDEPREAMAGVEFKVNFISPGMITGPPLRGEGALIRRGKNIAVCESRVFQGDKLLAVALLTYLVRTA